MDHTPSFLRLVESIRPHIHEIPVATALARHSAGAHLIDVREDSEWAIGHAAGAEHLGKGVIERDIETRIPDPTTELLLYCGGGFRSALAADVLQRMGYTNVHSIAGGWRAWHAAGAPIVGRPPEPEPTKP